jgi:hypothetical protein
VLIYLFEFSLHVLCFHFHFDDLIRKLSFSFFEAFQFAAIFLDLLLVIIFASYFVRQLFEVVVFIFFPAAFVCFKLVFNVRQHFLDFLFLNNILPEVKLCFLQSFLIFAHAGCFFQQFVQLKVIHASKLVNFALLDDVVRV